MVTVEEIRRCGISASGLSRRVRCGRLFPIHQGVYAVGHPGLSVEGRFIAATKACGPGAWLSHRAGAAFAKVRSWDGGTIDVSVPGENDRHHDGIRVHQSNLATRQDLVPRNGILVSNPTWLIFELASQINPRDLRSTMKHCLGERMTSLPALIRLLSRVRGHRGAGVLRRELARGAIPTRSELEVIVYDLIIEAGLRGPDVNVPLTIDGRTIVPDFRWPDVRFIVEADGARWHDNALARADDAERQSLLESIGERVERVTWANATDQRERTQLRLIEALAAASRQFVPHTGTK